MIAPLGTLRRRRAEVTTMSQEPQQQPEHEDFMPLMGIDHVEYWVGNARQAAYYYSKAFGFRVTAYAGQETGQRASASWVVEQGEARYVFTGGLSPESEITRHAF